MVEVLADRFSDGGSIPPTSISVIKRKKPEFSTFVDGSWLSFFAHFLHLGDYFIIFTKIAWQIYFYHEMFC